jgi:hypothetical protein
MQLGVLIDRTVDANEKTARFEISEMRLQIRRWMGWSRVSRGIDGLIKHWRAHLEFGLTPRQFPASRDNGLGHAPLQ